MVGRLGGVSDPSAPSEQNHEVTVDLAAFLPEGVALAAEEPVGDDPVTPAVDPDVIGRELDAVDAAIAALDDGTYGIDPGTGQPIDDARLAADPVSFR